MNGTTLPGEDNFNDLREFWRRNQLFYDTHGFTAFHQKESHTYMVNTPLPAWYEDVAPLDLQEVKLQLKLKNIEQELEKTRRILKHEQQR